MNKPTRVRLVDIARRLNLSKMSVSKALRNHPDISEETRALVEQTAAEMGYVPNHLARSLSSNRSRTLGVVVPRLTRFVAGVLDGVQACAAEHDYRVVLNVSQEDGATERRHLDALLALQVDGLLLSAAEDAPDLAVYERIRRLGVPLVFFDRAVEEAGCSTVTVDDEGGAFEVVDYALRQGYRRIGHLAGYAHHSTGRRRRAGYEHALRAHGVPLTPALVVEGGYSARHGYEGFRTLYEQGDLPEAIFTVSYAVAVGLQDALRALDPARAGQLQVLTFGQGDVDRFLPRPFACVHKPARQLGYEAAARLLYEIRHPEAEPYQMMLPTRLVTPEESLRPSYRDEVRWQKLVWQE